MQDHATQPDCYIDLSQAICIHTVDTHSIHT